MQIVIVTNNSSEIEVELLGITRSCNIPVTIFVATPLNFEDVVIANNIYNDLILITDEAAESDLWRKINSNVDQGFIITINQQNISVANNNIILHDVSDVKRAVRYLQASLEDNESKLRKSLLQVEISPQIIPVDIEKNVDNLEIIPMVFEEPPINWDLSEPVSPEYIYEEQIIKSDISENEVINHSSLEESTLLLKEIEDKKKELLKLDIKYQQRKRTQSMLFDMKYNDDCKVIGIWSPSQRQGVTTFTINYAHALSELGCKTIVLESLREIPYLKSKLKSYDTASPDWVSYAQCLKNSETDMKNAKWLYRNVMYLPLSQSDLKMEWTNEFLKEYVTNISSVDVILVDLENGPMMDYTKNFIKELDELWVMVDDSIHENISWKNFILEQKLEVKKSRLLFNKTFDFSKYDDIREYLDYEAVYLLPDLTYDVLQNNYMNEPVFYYSKDKVNEAYQVITNDLFGENSPYFRSNSKESVEIAKEVNSDEVNITNKVKAKIEFVKQFLRI